MQSFVLQKMFCGLNFCCKQVVQSGQLGQQLAGPRKTVGPLDLVAIFVEYM